MASTGFCASTIDLDTRGKELDVVALETVEDALRAAAGAQRREAGLRGGNGERAERIDDAARQPADRTRAGRAARKRRQHRNRAHGAVGEGNGDASAHAAVDQGRGVEIGLNLAVDELARGLRRHPHRRLLAGLAEEPHRA